MRYILYAVPGTKGSDAALALVNPRDPNLTVQNPKEIQTNLPWLTGTPILWDLHMNKIYNGTMCILQLQKMQPTLPAFPQTQTHQPSAQLPGVFQGIAIPEVSQKPTTRSFQSTQPVDGNFQKSLVIQSPNMKRNDNFQAPPTPTESALESFARAFQGKDHSASRADNDKPLVLPKHPSDSMDQPPEPVVNKQPPAVQLVESS